MYYAESLNYGYSPNIDELLNIHTEDEPIDNDLYCSSVLWNLYKFAKTKSKSFSNYIFRDCVRTFISLTPSNVGKFGCMWGTDDFLDWFQCVFNIRIFVINIQESKDCKFTTASFVNELLDKGTKSYEEKVSNDKYFDLNVKNRLIPYGIIIVLMEGSHFDGVFKLHDSTSPIIPAGTDKIQFLLPLLKISKTLWSSLSIDTIKRHNTDLIKSGEMDVNKELNFWFDHHTAMDKTTQMGKHIFCSLPDSEILTTFLTKKQNINRSSSVPCCAIRFPPKFLAYLIFFKVTQQEKAYDVICSYTEMFSINLQEDDIQQNKKHRDYLIKFITKQQQDNGKIYDVFNESKFVDDLQDMMETYKQLLHKYFQNKINVNKDKNCTEQRLKYPLSKNLLNINEVNKSIQEEKKRISAILEKQKKRSIALDDSSISQVGKKLKLSSTDTIIKSSGSLDVAMSTVDSNTSLSRESEMEISPTEESLTKDTDVDETLKNDTKSPTSETKDIIQDIAAVPPTDSQEKNKSIAVPPTDSQEENKSNEIPNSENTTGSPNPAT